MPLSMVTGQLNSYWSKEISHTDPRPKFDVALIRKHVMTKMHNFLPNLENELAKLMCNSWQMWKQTYSLEYKCQNISNQSTAPDYSERVKVNRKIFLVLYNRCLQMKLLIIKSHLLWWRPNSYKPHHFMIWQICRHQIRCSQSSKWKL